MSKLSEAQAEEIRVLIPKMYQRDIAKVFGVSQALISKIKNGQIRRIIN